VPDLRQLRELARDDITAAVSGVSMVGNSVLRVIFRRQLASFLEKTFATGKFCHPNEGHTTDQAFIESLSPP